ncbi:hypothetical protein BGZ72_002340 [Mortierella alpina]|nr:hypothetical protein BGZ72_002340 [Mortierella alpina]
MTDHTRAENRSSLESLGRSPITEKSGTPKATDDSIPSPQDATEKQESYADADFKKGPVSPEASASWLSKLTLWWLGGLFKTGYKRQLEEDDLYEMLDHNKAAFLYAGLSEHWEMEKKRAKLKGKQPSLLRATVKNFWRRYVAAAIGIELGDACQISAPLLLQLVIKFINSSSSESPPPAWHGYLIAVGMVLITILQNLFYQRWNLDSMVMGILVRGSLIDMVFRKATKLSAYSHLVYPDGAVVNLMSTDTSRIDTAMLSIMLVVSVPIYTIVIVGLLVHLLGAPALLGAAILILVNPIQGWIMSKLAPIRKQASEYTDSRIRLTSEVLQGIKVIKFFAWESNFLQKLSDIRKLELYNVGKLLLIRGMVAATSASLPVFASAFSFVLYSAIGNTLSPEIIFPALAFFTVLRIPLMVLPSAYTTAADAYVALKRIEKFLLSEEASSIPPPDQSHPYALTMKDASFTWEQLLSDSSEGSDSTAEKTNASSQGPTKSQQPPTSDGESTVTGQSDVASVSYLNKINLQVPRGSLVAVVGPVGSGKSSLLQAMIGNMTHTSGQLIRGSNISYAPQTPWIQNATIRDNILFDTPLDEERYWRVVKACCLEKDLTMFPFGDLTELGERGVNLSGGQKARLSLARSVYFQAGMVIMDDPLSAVDAHVGKRLWEDCMLNEMRDRTRIIATHQLHVLPDADYIICMKDGAIAEEGTYKDLMAKNGDFCALMAQYGGVQKDEAEVEEDQDAIDHAVMAKLEKGIAPKAKSVRLSMVGDSKEHYEGEELDDGSLVESTVEDDAKTKKAQKLMSDEERESGAVKGNVYGGYLRASGRLLWVGVFGFFILQQFANIMGNQWISWWSEDELELDQHTYIGIYVAWTLAQLLFVFIAATLLSYAVIKTANNLHDAAFKQVLFSPLAFFDTTPLGRILNRFSRDVDTLDNVLWSTLYESFITVVTLMGTMVLIIIIFPWLLLAIAPLMGLYYAISVYYRSTSREVKRLDSNMRSHLYAYFSECLTGLPTLKAYNMVHKAILKNEYRIDLNNRPYYLFQLGARWMSIRVNLLGATLTFSTVVLIVATRKTIHPASAGLVLSYLARISGDLNWGIQRLSTLENNMNSAERLMHYVTNLVQERPAQKPEAKPDPSWPAQGEISFQNVTMRYRPDLPKVLRDISFDIQAGHKVGVVGRTGAGKSSLIQALFLLSELEHGQIMLDGINTQDIGTADLRSHIAIIPQDPVLFQGTFRYNLDPLEKHTEQELWQVLETSDLKAYVQAQEGGLDAMVSAQGENLSVGQRQLVCLSRALLAKSKVVVLDEATASVDMATDALIQKAIRVDFATSTVMTVAHRINTIIDYDRILVMNKGQLAEYDSAYNLLSNPDSIFSSMVAETGAQNAAHLRSLVGL